MPSISPSIPVLFCGVILIACLTSQVSAFGAGNIASIAKIEGQNWRHGDIEDTLLNILMSRAAGGKKFGKIDVKRVYFGNWLRDYSQAVDVGTVKYVSAEAIRIILWVLGFMSFGYGTKEFEVTRDRLGCYRPEEHIDNPKDYADNLDARDYDRRLRGPVDERRELAVDQRTGLKNYIASEDVGITTSAGLVRNLFGRSIQLGRQYARSRRKADLYEALRLLGTGCHCLEDYSAHSNYTELALIELGERDVFPHVGRQTQMQLRGARGPVYPCITGTFGGVDFLHSVMGEFSDKAAQSEIAELDNTMQNSGQGDSSLLQDLLNQVPNGLFGGKDQAGKADELQSNAQAAQMQNMHVSPRDPEGWALQLQEFSKQIYPVLEWHDEMMQSIREAIEKIPILPALLEQLQEQINIFVFSLLAPFVVPVINQVKTELNTGSSEIIQSSKEKQLIVFRDDYSSDPTHSMLSKDHFSNILNEPAGKVASSVLKWVVPQLISCWDDERIDVDRTLTRIINGVFHHPALRDYGNDGAVDGRRQMFSIVEQWWSEKDEDEREILRDQLSRNGVEEGRNHKPGVHDTGHGCGKPLGMPNLGTASSSGAVGGIVGAGVLGEITDAFSGTSKYDAGFTGTSTQSSGGGGKFVEEAVGGGALGGLVGGIAGAVGGGFLGGAFSSDEKKTYQSERYEEDGSYTQSVSQTAYAAPQQRYGQAEYSQTTYQTGGQREEYQRYEQDDNYGTTGYGEQVIRDSRPTYGGGYEETIERRYEHPGGEWESETRIEGRDRRGETYEETITRQNDYESSNQGYGYRTQEQGFGGEAYRERDDYRERSQGYGGGNAYERNEYEGDRSEERETFQEREAFEERDTNEERETYEERDTQDEYQERRYGESGYGEEGGY